MNPRLPRRATALALAGVMTLTLLGTALAGSALATSPLDLARHRHASLTHTIVKIRHHQRRDSGHLGRSCAGPLSSSS